MPFQVSPGVNVSEIDLTTVVPAVSSTEGAIAGVFRWGPVGKRVLVDSETLLVSRFFKPNNFNAETFFTAANFLSYGNKLYVVRVANTTYDAAGSTANNLCRNAFANTASITAVNTAVVNSTYTDSALHIVKSDDDFETKIFTAVDADMKYVARYPGALGNSLKISVCDSVAAYSQNSVNIIVDSGGVGNTYNPATSNIAYTTGSSNLVVTIAFGAAGNIASATTRATTMTETISVGDTLVISSNTVTVKSVGAVSANATAATFTVVLNETWSASGSSTTFNRTWQYASAFSAAPGTSKYQSTFGNTSAVDEVHAVIVDEDGKFTGVPGTILEKYEGVSRATDAKTEDGSTNYIKDVINQLSQYVWYINDRTNAAANVIAELLSSATTTGPMVLSFVGGLDGQDETSIPVGVLQTGYDLFASAEDVDISLVLQGKARGSTTDASGENSSQVTLANYLINSITEKRKDCVAFISPNKFSVVGDPGDEATNMVSFRNALASTSYAVLDSGYKYQYDKYNDMYRYVPLNGDTAGLCVRTDELRDPWWSPAGFNRGQIKNIVKLAYNPRQAFRDTLYKSGINPVVTFPGQGTILYGDKTLLAKPSAFDRINVRRLFIVLEKAIATAAKFTLFEFNDDFTRAQFRNLVEPFLRDVQGRRGIYDFKVVCDTSNNTGEVIDRNEFVGDIYIKPAKSINFIQLNFVAVRTGVEFNEIVGQF